MGHQLVEVATVSAYQWLGYLTEIGVQVGVGSGGGKKEADVVGAKISETDETGGFYKFTMSNQAETT